MSTTRKSPLQSLSDSELLRRLSELLRQSRRVESELVAHIAEVDQRRLYGREASPSMYAYCTEILHLSEAEAYLRIAVARASREHPRLLEMLADGRLHLSGIQRLAPCLTRENRDKVLARAARKSRRQIEELLAELAPKPDIPTAIRKLPEPARTTETKRAPRRDPEEAPSPSLELCPDRARVAPARPPAMAPLAPARYKVQFTASAELREKLGRLQDLMRSSVPDGDLAKIIEAAVTEKLERLEARRFAKTKAPRKTLKGTKIARSSRQIPAAVRRVVYTRDEGRCTFVDALGRRCTAHERLEFHHQRPYGRGGDHSPRNIRLLCRAHNQHLADRDYGKEVMTQHRRSPTRVSEAQAVYTLEGQTARAHWWLSGSPPARMRGYCFRRPALPALPSRSVGRPSRGWSPSLRPGTARPAATVGRVRDSVPRAILAASLASALTRAQRRIYGSAQWGAARAWHCGSSE